MVYSKTFKELKVVNNSLNNLSDQPHVKGVSKGNYFKNSIPLKQGKKIVHAITVCDDESAYKKSDRVSFSNYYMKNLRSFQTDIFRFVKNRIVLKKHDEITPVKQRISERYTPTHSDEIQFIIPCINKTYKPLNVGIRGICIASDENLMNDGLIFSQCILQTHNKIFFVDSIIRNFRNDISGYWKFGIELSFSDSISFFQYLECIFSLLQKDIYSSQRMSIENIKTDFGNTRSMPTNNDDMEVKDIHKEIKSWGNQDLIGPLHCNLAQVKNKILVSACSARRIYNNTFFAQRLVYSSDLYISDTPKIKIYASLSDLLIHHPSCKYLMIYKSHDIEWYEGFFNEVVNFSKNPSDVHIKRLNFIDISIDIDDSKTVNNTNNTFFITPLLDKNNFYNFTNHNLPSIINNSHNYLESPNDTDLISDLLNAAGHSMVRKIYKITNKDKIVAFAVCEVFSDGYIINNSLDLCRIYYCTDIKNHSKLLDGIIKELSIFYASHRKSSFRIIWENRKVNVNEITVINDISHNKGNLLRLVVSKQGLFSLHQAALLLEDKFTKYFYYSYPQQSKQYLNNSLSDPNINNPVRYIDSVSNTQNKTSNKRTSYLKFCSEPLLQHFQDGKVEDITSSAISYIPEYIPDMIGISRDQIRKKWFNNNPMWYSVMETHLGRIALLIIPLFGDEVYNNPKLVNETVRAIELAGKINAPTVSLLGLIPSASRYGYAIAEAIEHRNDLPMISTGHATTCASVVLSIDKILESGGSRTNLDKIAFIGLGSIGQSTLLLMMKSIPHPKELILCDPFMKREKVDKIQQQLISGIGFQGKISIVSPREKNQIPVEIYSADLIVGATNVPNILDIKKIRPGTMIVDDSAPHCFNPKSAIQRFKDKGDILFSEGGFLRSPHPIKQLIFHPSFLNRKTPLLELDPFNISGCIFSSLLFSKYSDLKPTMGLVDVDSSMKYYLKLKDLGYKGADLHCCDFRQSSPFLFNSDMIRSFQQRFSRKG